MPETLRPRKLCPGQIDCEIITNDLGLEFTITESTRALQPFSVIFNLYFPESLAKIALLVLTVVSFLNHWSAPEL